MLSNVGKSARLASSHPSSANLTMDMPAGKIVSLTPTLSLNQLTISHIQSYMKPAGTEGTDVDHSDASTASTPADSPRKGVFGDRISSMESSGSSSPGLWLGSRRSPGREFLFFIFCKVASVLSRIYKEKVTIILFFR